MPAVQIGQANLEVPIIAVLCLSLEVGQAENRQKSLNFRISRSHNSKRLN